MPEKAETPRPTSLIQHKEISFSFLAERIGRENAEIVWRHLSPEAVRGDPKTATCYTVAGTPKRLSGEMVNQGLQLLVADQGKVPGTPSVVISLDTLASMLGEARGKPSIIDALAASEELPAVSPFTIRTGEVNCLSRRRAWRCSRNVSSRVISCVLDANGSVGERHVTNRVNRIISSSA